MLDVSSLELTMAKTKNRDYNKIIVNILWSTKKVISDKM